MIGTRLCRLPVAYDASGKLIVISNRKSTQTPS
jgi:hypothetical protein